jgi:hypothetical protein
MAPSSRFSWPSLAAFFFLLLSLLNIATASPLPADVQVKKSLVARDDITQERYEAYLDQFFPDNSRYLFYTGKSEEQVKAFMAQNPGYHYYGDIFNTGPDLNHPWYQFFDGDVDEDDGEASSRALATKASGNVMIFGGIEYKTEGDSSIFVSSEIKQLLQGLADGRISSLSHMAKGATNPSQVMATEDASGFTFKNGWQEGDKNFGAPDSSDTPDGPVRDDDSDSSDDED